VIAQDHTAPGWRSRFWWRLTPMGPGHRQYRSTRRWPLAVPDCRARPGGRRRRL